MTKNEGKLVGITQIYILALIGNFCQVSVVFASLSNCVETATRWYKAQEHLSPINLYIS